MVCVITLITVQSKLNKQQLSYVNNHLTYKQCLLLNDALQEKGIIINITNLDDKMKSGKSPTDSCFTTLERMNNKYDHSRIELRLRQIGLRHIANVISQKRWNMYSLDGSLQYFNHNESLHLNQSVIQNKMIGHHFVTTNSAYPTSIYSVYIGIGLFVLIILIILVYCIHDTINKKYIRKSHNEKK